MSIKVHLAAAALLVVAGCANDPAPTEQLRLTEQAVEQARAVGATEELRAFKQASDTLQQVRASMADQAYKQARMQAEQAELDARLAEAQVLTAKSKEQIDLQNARIKRLRKQLEEVQ